MNDSILWNSSYIFDDLHRQSTLDRIYIGLTYFLLAVFLCLIGILSMYLLITDTKSLKQPYHRIMINIGVCDLGQLLFVGVASGLFTMSNCTPYFLNKLVGSIADASWFMFLVSAHLLAVNRFMHVFLSLKVKRIFSSRLTILYLMLIWTYGLVWFVSLNTPLLSLLYWTEYYTFDYDANAESRVISKIDMWTDVINISSMFLIYCSIYVRSRASRKLMVNDSQRKILSMKKDTIVLIQAVSICSTLTIFIVFFYTLPLVCDGSYCYVATNLSWIISAGFNPVIYFIANKRFRQRFLITIRCIQAPSSEEKSICFTVQGARTMKNNTVI